MIRLLKPHDRILLVTADSLPELGRMFVRAQEFYESPYKSFRRRYFDLERFKAFYRRHVSDKGQFTYYSDFGGYNVPGDVFLDWQATFAGNETEDEQRLLQILGPLPDAFYLIGAKASDAGTTDHELSHALFHLYPDYRRDMVAMQKGEDLAEVRRFLLENMYSPDVYDDEITSYVLFDHAMLKRNGVRVSHLKPLQRQMLKVFNDYRFRCLRPRGQW